MRAKEDQALHASGTMRAKQVQRLEVCVGRRVTVPMVGRQVELNAAVAAVDDGLAGIARVLLVRGEAGIGKTRLVEEVRAHIAATDSGAETTGTVVAVAQCVETGAIGTPFAPNEPVP